MDTIRVAVTRGEMVEAVHHFHAAAVRDGRSWPRPATPGSSRSSAPRPSRSRRFRSRALATTSTTATSRSRPRRTSPRPTSSPRCGPCSRRRRRREHDLECGSRADAPRAQLLGQARGDARALPDAWLAAEGYRLPEHPAQQGCLAEVAAAAEVDPATIPTAVDGCGVVTFALPLERMAEPSRGSSRSTPAPAWPRRCARTPI